MQELLTSRPHWLHKAKITLDDTCSGALVGNTLAVSHRCGRRSPSLTQSPASPPHPQPSDGPPAHSRWTTPDDPDPSGEQLAELRAFLREHRDVDRVFYDYACMPQGFRLPYQVG